MHFFRVCGVNAAFVTPLQCTDVAIELSEQTRLFSNVEIKDNDYLEKCVVYFGHVIGHT